MRALRYCQMEELRRTKGRYLDHARLLEKHALSLAQEVRQEVLLDLSVSLRVLASLPSSQRLRG